MRSRYTVSGFKMVPNGKYEDYEPWLRGHPNSGSLMEREVVTAGNNPGMFIPEVETLYSAYAVKGKVDASLIIDTTKLITYAIKKLRLRAILSESLSDKNPGFGMRDSFTRDFINVLLTGEVKTNASVYFTGITPVGTRKHMPRTPSDAEKARNKTNIAALGVLTDKQIVSSLLSAVDVSGNPVGVPYTLGILRFVFGIAIAESI